MTSTTAPSTTTDASTVRSSWRVVDIVTASVLGVAAGVIFWAWGLAWTPLSTLLSAFAPLAGLLAGGWLFAGVLGGLVIRKPGAALFCEVVAAVVSMMVGTQWGFSVAALGRAAGPGAPSSSSPRSATAGSASRSRCSPAPPRASRSVCWTTPSPATSPGSSAGRPSTSAAPWSPGS